MSDTIQVLDSFTDAAVRVDVNIPHTYIGDLIVTLEHGGRMATLHNRTGGGEDDLVFTYDLDDFDGVTSTGAWILHIADRAGRDLGQLEQWQLALIE